MKDQAELEIIRAELGEDVYWKLLEIFQGQSVYFPKNPLMREKRDEIEMEFRKLLRSGMTQANSISALAQRFGLTKRWIRIICLGR